MLTPFGICPCGGSFEARRVEVRFTHNERLSLLNNVEQGACPQCSSRVYKTSTLERIECAFRDEPTDRVWRRLLQIAAAGST